MRKQSTITARGKKLIVSILVLLIFIFPLAVSLRWMGQVVAVMSGTDTRKVYSANDIAKFKDSNCTVNTEGLKPFDEPLITITFDDGWESIYSNGLEALEQNCIKSSQYILGDHFDEPNYMSKKQVHSMQNAGHEIASHTMTHPNLTHMSPDSLAYELGESDRKLSDEFGEMREFASPLGASNGTVLDEVKKYYRSHRNTASDPATLEDVDINVRETFDRYNINAYTVRRTTTVEDIERLIEYTKQRNGWLVLTYHEIGESDSPFAVTEDTLYDHLAIVRQSGVRTPVMGQVIDAILAREAGRQ